MDTKQVGGAMIYLATVAVTTNYLLGKYPGATDILNLDIIAAALLIAAPGAGVALYYFSDSGY